MVFLLALLLTYTMDKTYAEIDLRRTFPNKSCIAYVGDDNKLLYEKILFYNFTVITYKSIPTILFNCGYVFYYEHISRLLYLFQKKYRHLRNYPAIVLTRKLELMKFSRVSAFKKVNKTIRDKFFKAKTEHFLTNMISERWIVSGKDFGNFKKQYDLSNATLKVAVFTYYPYLIVKNGNVVGGVEKHILDYIVGKLKVKYVALPPFSWIAARQLVVNNTCDFTVTSQNKLYQDFNAVDVSVTYMTATCTLLVPKPRILPIETFVFQPFHLDVYCVFISFACAVAGLYYISFKFLVLSPPYTNYLNIFIDVIGTLCGKPLVGKMASSLGLLLICLNLLSLLGTTSYSAGFATSLSKPRFAQPTKTFKDIYDNSLKTTYDNVQPLLATSLSPYALLIANRSDVYDSAQKEGQIYTANTYQKFVFLGDDLLPVKRRSELVLLSESILEYEYVVPCQKNSPYSSMINEKLTKAIEYGLVDHWFRITMYQNFTELKEMSGYYSYYVKTNETKRPLNFRLQGAFYALLTGFLISMMSFFVEQMLINEAKPFY